MKEIILTQNKVALVDDEDYEYLNQWKWRAAKNSRTWYAIRNINHGYRRETVNMHREIMKTPKNMECDHVFHNGLDNRKYIKINDKLEVNLRNCTHTQNNQNRSASINGTSKYLGVRIKNGKYIQAQILVNKKYIHLGTFENEFLAAITYDFAAIKHFGEFANLNFKEITINMAKKSEYSCILYKEGDKVVAKYGDGKVFEIEATRLAPVGQFTCQFLKFKDEPEDLGAFSNLYLYADDKYKDGLKYLDEIKVAKMQNKSVTAGIKVHRDLARKLLKSNVLTEEDLKPVVVPRGMFNAKPPIKENI